MAMDPVPFATERAPFAMDPAALSQGERTHGAHHHEPGGYSELGAPGERTGGRHDSAVGAQGDEPDSAAGDDTAGGGDGHSLQHGGEHGSVPSVPGPQDAHDRVQRSYDAVAEDYLARFDDELDHKPLDRSLLGALVEQAGPDAVVADLGCGPGHVAAWMAARGVRCVGIDLSPAMVTLGRRQHPEVEFRQGDLLALPATDGEFGALVAFYTIIHLEEGELPAAFAEMARVLRPGGLALVSFHGGAELRHLDEWFSHPVDLDFRFFDRHQVTEAMAGGGLAAEAWLERRHYPGEAETPRVYVLARSGAGPP
jgi:SAM-dependent methyltransferase